MTAPSVVLAIGGFDSSGGAGTLADARAIQLNGGYPCAVVTAVTAQNTTNVEHIAPLSTESLRHQFRCVIEDFQVDAIKIGLIPSFECVRTLVQCISENQLNCPMVIDPVMCATSGTQLVDDDVMDTLIESLIPLTTLITPNIDEASNLTNRPIESLDDAIESGRQLLDIGCENVLVKGGHLDVDKGTDAWCYEGGFETFEPVERQGGTVRGTGCMLSSAIACQLSQGKSMRDAILASKAFVSRAISERQTLGKGTPLTTVSIQD